jgi:RimJ/RimL family protein N-acetyltransferase
LVTEIINAKQTSLSDDEIKSIVEIDAHPNVKQWLIIYVDEDFEKEFQSYKQFFKNLPEESDAEVLVAKYDGNIAGFLVLWRLEDYMKHVASVGISVHPNFWGKGIANSLMNAAINLAEEKGYKRLEVETLAENVAMRRTAEKAGFKLEGTRTKRVFKNGSYHDEVAYYLLLKK